MMTLELTRGKSFTVGSVKLVKPSSKIFLLTVPRQYFFCGSFVLFLLYVCHAFASVHNAALWSPAWKGLTSWILFVMFNCVFVTFPCGILVQVWYLIVSISDLCCLSYFYDADHYIVKTLCGALCLCI